MNDLPERALEKYGGWDGVLAAQVQQEAARPKFIIDQMVSAFLSWRLPMDFAPDAGIAFTPLSHPAHWPSGTNLLNADQARLMVAHILGSARSRDARYSEAEGDAFTDGYFTGADEATTHPAANALGAVRAAPVSMRELAKVIRKYGTCAPAALELVASRIEAALAQAPAVRVTDDAVREYVNARNAYEDATRPPNSHAQAPRIPHDSPVLLRYRNARAALESALGQGKGS